MGCWRLNKQFRKKHITESVNECTTGDTKDRQMIITHVGIKGEKRWKMCGLWPLLAPSGPRRTVHSSIWPKVSNSRRTSSSLCCLPSIPTNSFLSSALDGGGGWKRGEKKKCYSWWHHSAELKRTTFAPPQHTQLSLSTLRCVVVVDVFLWCSTPPWYNSDISQYPESYSSLLQWFLMYIKFGVLRISGKSRKERWKYFAHVDKLLDHSLSEMEHSTTKCVLLLPE